MNFFWEEFFQHFSKNGKRFLPKFSLKKVTTSRMTNIHILTHWQIFTFSLIDKFSSFSLIDKIITFSIFHRIRNHSNNHSRYCEFWHAHMQVCTIFSRSEFAIYNLTSRKVPLSCMHEEHKHVCIHIISADHRCMNIEQCYTHAAMICDKVKMSEGKPFPVNGWCGTWGNGCASSIRMRRRTLYIHFIDIFNHNLCCKKLKNLI